MREVATNLLYALLIVWAMHLIAASFTDTPTRTMALIQRGLATILVVAACLGLGA